MGRIAVCQPYFCPHIGYFQLIDSVDLFVSYDDVNYIKGGWINRNKILVNGNENFITIPLKNQSSFRKINETFVNWGSKNIGKMLKTIELSYSKTRYRDDVLDVINKILDPKPEKISELALNSIKGFCDYLDIKTEIKVSSVEGYEKTDDRVKNLINICEKEDLNHYINPIGGTKLYNKGVFGSYGVKLNFIKTPVGLSIIDVCMNTPKEEIKEQLKNFELI